MVCSGYDNDHLHCKRSCLLSYGHGFDTSLIFLQTSGWQVFLRGNWAVDVFVTNYIPFVLFPILYIGARIYYRQGPVKAEDMDFVSDLAEIEAES